MPKSAQPQWIRERDGLWRLGDDEKAWYVARCDSNYYLMVSSGVEYGPYESLIDAKKNAVGMMGCN